MQSEHLNIRDEERHRLYLSRNAQTWSGRKSGDTFLKVSRCAERHPPPWRDDALNGDTRLPREAASRITIAGINSPRADEEGMILRRSPRRSVNRGECVNDASRARGAELERIREFSEWYPPVASARCDGSFRHGRLSDTLANLPHERNLR